MAPQVDIAHARRWAAALMSARAGDPAPWEAALAEIAAMLRPLIRARMARMGLSAEDAEEALQETLIALHLRQASWDADRPILPWIRAIARHKSLDIARREGRRRARALARPVEDLAEILPAPPGPRPELADAERLLAGLPARERGVVSALGIEGESVAAVARRLSITESAVRVAFHRGLRRLRGLALTEAPA
ncbi:MAG: sigma-70 family RNA polymerase sigma factor [Alphaproteobacteria bacterium]|nr:MAG: sigma-70 family RNA polymerase sigma factor [Alphaproteobacteria bacterium]